jgi:uncharacterized membrane protein YGL010W
VKSLSQWLDEYAESHQNKTNKLIHFICIPVIFYSLYLLLFCIDIPSKNSLINIANLVYAGCLWFWFKLNFRLGIYFMILGFAMALSTLWIEGVVGGFNISIFGLALSLFVLAWIGQFVGHKMEGKKPSFVKDIQFLLIGPAWIVHALTSKK